jgi:hypothetical protein
MVTLVTNFVPPPTQRSSASSASIACKAFGAITESASIVTR